MQRGRLVGMLTVGNYFNHFLAAPLAIAQIENRRWA
jgi:hypothetical protein